MNNLDIKKIKLMYLVRYFGDSLFFTFYQIYILSLGYTEAQLGIFSAITPLVIIFANPVWNYFAKDINASRKIMRVMAIIEGIVIILYGGIQNFEVLCVLIFLIAIVDNPFYSLLDGYTQTISTLSNVEYSSIRKMGSIAYIFGCLAGALFINFLGYQNTFIISGLLYALAGFMFIFIKPLELPKEINHKHGSLRNIINNKRFILYSLFFLLTYNTGQIGVIYYNAFLVNVREVSDSTIGYIKALSVCCEVLVIIMLNKYKIYFKESTLILSFGVLSVLSFLSVALDLPTYLIIPAIIFNGASIGVMIFVHLNYVIKLVGRENITSAVVFLAIVGAIYTSGINLLLGVTDFINLIGYHYFMFIIVGVGITSVLFRLIGSKIYNVSR